MKVLHITFSYVSQNITLPLSDVGIVLPQLSATKHVHYTPFYVKIHNSITTLGKNHRKKNPFEKIYKTFHHTLPLFRSCLDDIHNSQSERCSAIVEYLLTKAF